MPDYFQNTVSIVEEDFRSVAEKAFSLSSLSFQEIVISAPTKHLPSPAVRYLTIHMNVSQRLQPLAIFGKVHSCMPHGHHSDIRLLPLRMTVEDFGLMQAALSPGNDSIGRQKDIGTSWASSKLCLITGATGFVGSHLALRLASQGFPIRIAVRNPAKAKLFNAYKNVDVQIGDLTNPAFVGRIVRDVAHVFHCAGYVSDWGTPQAFDLGNRVVTQQLARACVGLPIDCFVHLSTTDVYGYPDSPDEIGLSAPRKSGLPYADSKGDAEKAVRECMARGLRATILRPATIYGPGSETIVKEFVKTLRDKKMLWISGGLANAGLCYVENLVDAILLTAQSPQSIGQSYNLTDDQPISWKDFIVTLAQVLRQSPPRLSLPYRFLYACGWMMECLTSTSSPRRPWVTRTAVNLLGKSQKFPVTQIKQELGYEPRKSFLEAMVETEKWIRTQP
jgi:nucleoside-diphosphate-sugar epimerase